MATGIQLDFILAGLVDNTNGLPLTGGKVETFDAGTTNPQTTFQDVNLTINHTNPVILDSQGRATIFVANDDIKLVIKDLNDVVQQTIDNLHYVRFDANVTNRNVRTVSATVLLDGLTDDFIAADTSTGSFTVQLPPAGQVSPVAITGKEFIIKKVDSSVNTVTIDPDGTELIEGSATLVLNDLNETATIRSDGSNWRIISQPTGPGSGLNADLLDGLDSLQFLRSDVTNTSLGSIIFANDEGIVGTTTSAAIFTIIEIDSGDIVRVGDSNVPLEIQASVSPTVVIAGGGTDLIWTAESDGPGTGMNADLIDGFEASQLLARANHTGTQIPSTISPQGAGSGLDADLLDGQQASAFAQTNSKQVVQVWALVTAAGALTNSLNVSSITKNGAGDYTVNFSVTLSNANFVVAGTALNRIFAVSNLAVRTTTSVRVVTLDSSGGNVDAEFSLMIVGDA